MGKMKNLPFFEESHKDLKKLMAVIKQKIAQNCNHHTFRRDFKYTSLMKHGIICFHENIFR